MLYLLLHLQNSIELLHALSHVQNVLLYMFHVMPVQSCGIAVVTVLSREAPLLPQGHSRAGTLYFMLSTLHQLFPPA